MFRLLITARSFGQANPDIFKKIEKIKGVEYFKPDHDVAFSEAEMIGLVGAMNGIIVGTDKITRPVIEQAKNLKIILKNGVGVDNIDMSAATGAGIMVTNIPGVNDISVAEMTFAFILSLSRNIVHFYDHGQQGCFDKLLTRCIYGKTLGVIGTGRIGSEVISRALAFGMKILAYDLIKNEAAEKMPDLHYTDLDFLLGNSDIITLHIPLTDATEGLIGLPEVEKMKKGSFLVNTSRPGIVDEKAVVNAIRKGKLGGAGLDVLHKFPPDYDYLDLGSKLLITPHVSAYTYEALGTTDFCNVQAIQEFVENGVPTSVNILNRADIDILKMTGH